jgi:PleD family two-component response regulator
MRSMILIVDDNASARSTIKTILDEDEYDYTEAQNGEEALAAIKERDFDVIFLDLQLPDCDGLDFLAAARGIREDLGRVIILTGDANDDSRRRSFELGAADYLSKSPIEWNEIWKAFKNALAARARKGHMPL